LLNEITVENTPIDSKFSPIANNNESCSPTYHVGHTTDVDSTPFVIMETNETDPNQSESGSLYDVNTLEDANAPQPKSSSHDQERHFDTESSEKCNSNTEENPNEGLIDINDFEGASVFVDFNKKNDIDNLIKIQDELENLELQLEKISEKCSEESYSRGCKETVNTEDLLLTTEGDDLGYCSEPVYANSEFDLEATFTGKGEKFLESPGK
jgi:hypothetical protein